MYEHVGKSATLIILAISCARSNPDYWSSSMLNPVHGLFVKPSSDGVTGDLFVAATEDHGMKSHWIVDKPINFLPIAAATQPQAAMLSVFPSTIDENATKKRAVLPNSVQGPPVQYAYALPVSSTEGTALSSFPYAYPIPSPPTENSANKCDQTSTVPQYPFQYPFQFFYPQLTSAYSNAMAVLKDAGLNEETASSVMTQDSPVWPTFPYNYPMYLMISPGACAQAHTSPTVSTSTPSPSAEESAQS